MKRFTALLLVLVLFPCLALSETVVTSFYPVWIMTLNLTRGLEDHVTVRNLAAPSVYHSVYGSHHLIIKFVVSSEQVIYVIICVSHFDIFFKILDILLRTFSRADYCSALWFYDHNVNLCQQTQRSSDRFRRHLIRV